MITTESINNGYIVTLENGSKHYFDTIDGMLVFLESRFGAKGDSTLSAGASIE